MEFGLEDLFTHKAANLFRVGTAEFMNAPPTQNIVLGYFRGGLCLAHSGFVPQSWWMTHQRIATTLRKRIATTLRKHIKYRRAFVSNAL